MQRAALRIVEAPGFYTDEVELWSPESRGSHSLHYGLFYPDAFPAELPSYFINKYTKRGETVLDPFCGGGTAALEAVINGRAILASDLSPFAIRAARARLLPADITEVTLWLQMVNFSRPAALSQFKEVFAPFYDVDTFREILNLRAALRGRTDRTSRFIEMLSASLMHGHSAGYFSVYTFPQVALSPREQQSLNIKRSQAPEYRAVAPRLLRKAAIMLRDGIPSVMRQMEGKSRIEQSDARDLSYVGTGAVDLAICTPPTPGSADWSKDMWLRFWFMDLPEREQVLPGFPSQELEDWLEFMNEVLLELARVVKPAGRAVLDLREVSLDGRPVALDNSLVALVSESLSRFWIPEYSLVNRPKGLKVGSTRRERDDLMNSSNRVLVMRRK